MNPDHTQNKFLPLAAPLAVMFAAALSLAACGGGGGGGNKETTPTVNGNNPSVAARTSLLNPGDPVCANGGVLVETGIDENSNGVLDASEVDASEKVCNGAPGSNGLNGTSGLNALVKISNEAAGNKCSEGGRRIDSGLDTNANAQLDAAEIVSTDYICNGAAGTPGSNGLNALINMNPEPVGVNCRNGGLRIDVGIDNNGNGSLDAAEITQTGFVCSGTDGGVGWQVAALLEKNNAGSAYFPRIAVDDSGNAIAVWQQSDGTRTNIWANRYVVGLGWSQAQLIETDNVGAATAPRVSVDSRGNAVAVWRQFDGSLYNAWANHYSVGTGWGKALLIETNKTGNITSPQVSTDNKGNAIAVWTQSDGTRYSIWANRYVPGTGWQGAVTIETSAESASAPQVTVDNQGNAIAVWRQWDGLLGHIWSNRYTAGKGWGSAALIETDSSGNMQAPQLSMNASGDTIAVWERYDSVTASNSVWANLFVAGLGWGTESLVAGSTSTSAQVPQAAFNNNGNAMVIWRQTTTASASPADIWARRYIAGSGWGTQQLIEDNNAGRATNPQIALDSRNNAVAVWHQSDGIRDNIWSNRYVPGMGWGTAELVETDNIGSAQAPQLALDSSGNAMVVWHQNSATFDYNIWANRWLAP